MGETREVRIEILMCKLKVAVEPKQGNGLGSK